MQQRSSSRRLSERSPNWQRHSLEMRTVRYFTWHCTTQLWEYQFVKYVSETWIQSTTWPASSWSVYMMAIRTNNDIEGWHNGLHRRASGKWNMPFYLLIDLLHQEAWLTELRIRLVSEKKLKRIQRAKYRSLQAKIFELWDDFSNQRKNADQLLKQCAHLNGPCKAFAQPRD